MVVGEVEVENVKNTKKNNDIKQRKLQKKSSMSAATLTRSRTAPTAKQLHDRISAAVWRGTAAIIAERVQHSTSSWRSPTFHFESCQLITTPARWGGWPFSICICVFCLPFVFVSKKSSSGISWETSSDESYFLHIDLCIFVQKWNPNLNFSALCWPL